MHHSQSEYERAFSYGKNPFWKGVLTSWPSVRKSFICENAVTDKTFHCLNKFHNDGILKGRTLPLETHPNYTSSAIVRDNQNCQLEFRSEGAQRYILYTREQLFSGIPELGLQIPAAIDSFFDGCQKVLHNTGAKLLTLCPPSHMST